MWWGDEYQAFLIFIALIIAGGERWAMGVQWFPPDLSPMTRVGGRAHRLDGNQA